MRHIATSKAHIQKRFLDLQFLIRNEICIKERMVTEIDKDIHLRTDGFVVESHLFILIHSVPRKKEWEWIQIWIVQQNFQKHPYILQRRQNFYLWLAINRQPLLLIAASLPSITSMDPAISPALVAGLSVKYGHPHSQNRTIQCPRSSLHLLQPPQSNIYSPYNRFDWFLFFHLPSACSAANQKTHG